MRLKFYKKGDLTRQEAWVEWFNSEGGKIVRCLSHDTQEKFEELLWSAFMAGYSHSGKGVVVYSKYTDEERREMERYIKNNRISREKSSRD